LEKNKILITFEFRFPSQTQTPWMFGETESKPTEELKSETLKPSMNQAQSAMRVATAGAVSALRPQFTR
jgi:hypothetical protein